MKDFTFNIPTKIYFGKDNLDKLPEEIKKYGKKVLLVYGKNSIKKIGLYDEIVELFKKMILNIGRCLVLFLIQELIKFERV